MAQTTIDFSTNITDGTAGGGTGDNVLVVGGFQFTITAQGNWTANFNDGQFNFIEDAAVGGENFNIAITAVNGDKLDLYDYQLSVQGTPELVGNWTSGIFVTSRASTTNWPDQTFTSGGPAYYLASFAGQPVPAISYANSLSIFDQDIPDQTYSGSMTIWFDNMTFETTPNTTPNLVPSLTATAVSPIYTENAAAADLFSGVTAATNNAGQTFAGMMLTVSGLLDGSSEKLTIGGSAVTLTNGTSGSISGIGNYTVSVSSGIATITLTGMTASNSAMATLIDGLGYSVSGEDPSDGNRVVTITQLTDSGTSSNVLTTSIASTVNVNPVNDAPTGSATAVLAAGTEDVSFVVAAADLLQGFSDIEDDSLSIANLTASSSASVVDNNDGTYTITPLANFNGTMTLSYSVIDGNGGSVPGTRTVALSAVEDAPTGSATATLAAGTEDTTYIVTLASLTAGFTDADGDELSVANLTGSNGAVVVDNLDGSWTITPVADFNGQLTLDYMVEDGNGGSVAGQQTVNFAGTNDGPTAVDDTGALAEGQSLAFDVLANDSDIDVGDTLAVVNPVVTSANATAIIDVDGNLLVTYTGTSLDEGETGQVVITYDAFDGTTSDSATLTVTVTGVYDDGDDITGSDAGETLTGSNQGETIVAGGGSDTIVGLGGDDLISAGSGADIIRGGDGDDLLMSGRGADRIYGGLGKDTIIGWGGNDRLTGNGDSDVFVFHFGDGKDVITDFDTRGGDRDRIDLSNITRFGSFRDVRDAMEMQGGDALIKTSGGDTIRLDGIDMSDLSHIHFIF